MRAACSEICAAVRVVVPSRIRSPVRSASQTSFACSNALPVRMLERDPRFRHRAPLHQGDLEAVVEGEPLRLWNLEVARHARLRRLRGERRGAASRGGRLRGGWLRGGWLTVDGWPAAGFPVAGSARQGSPGADWPAASDRGRQRRLPRARRHRTAKTVRMRIMSVALAFRGDGQDRAVGRAQVLLAPPSGSAPASPFGTRPRAG